MAYVTPFCSKALERIRKKEKVVVVEDMMMMHVSIAMTFFPQQNIKKSLSHIPHIEQPRMYV